MYRTKIVLPVALYSLLVLSLFSCNDPGTLGLDLQSDELLVDVGYVDTFNIELSTVFFDSVNTTNWNRQLLGRYEDSDMGILKGTAYYNWRLASESEVELVPDDVSMDSVFYDSTKLSLVYDYVYRSLDTSVAQNFTVKELDISVDTSGDTKYYSFNQLPTTNSLADTMLKPSATTNVFVMDLPHTYGQQFYDVAIAGNVAASTDITSISKGIAISTDDNAQTMYGIQSNSLQTEMQIHYHYILNGDTLSRIWTLPFGARFHQLEIDRTGTDLVSLTTSGDDLASTATINNPNTAYLEAGTGLYIRAKFPEAIKDFSFANKRVINKAELSFRPIDGSLASNQGAPSILNFLQTDANGRILYSEFDFPTPIISDLGGALSSTYSPNGLTYSVLTVTDFIGTIINGDANSDFIISPEVGSSVSNSPVSTTINKLLIGNRDNTNTLVPMTLKIYYTEFR